jgi:hypothetical protein
MKLEFLKNINGYDEHAVRLSDFNSSEATAFCGVVDRLISDNRNPIDLSVLDFIRPVNCNLILRISAEDLGISTYDHMIFFCDLTLASYRNILRSLQSFCLKESKGYQWLYDIDTPIGFLFSAGKDIPTER